MEGLDDPDKLALLMVQQYLAEMGWDRALREVEAASGSTYYEGRAPRGSMLLEVRLMCFKSETDHSIAVPK